MKVWTARAKAAGIPGSEQKAWAHRRALRERFWTVPYHYVCLLDAEELLYNNPVSWYTYHGNRANPGLGFSVCGLFPAFEANRKAKHTAASDHHLRIAQTALHQAVEHARHLGCPIAEFRAHRQYSPRRQADPGEWIWKQIVEPVAEDLGLEINYVLSQDGGRPIPTAWSPAALYDRRGNLLSAAD